MVYRNDTTYINSTAYEIKEMYMYLDVHCHLGPLSLQWGKRGYRPQADARVNTIPTSLSRSVESTMESSIFGVVVCP